MTAIPLRQIEGKYEILEKLGEGGMGTVYKVRHRLLDEIRVIKVMRPQPGQEEDLKARFFREARVAIQLRHPSIAQLYDFSLDEDGIAFIVMEHIEGITLENLLHHQGPLPLGLVLEIAQQTLKALHYLHGKGFVHRDISPDNLMLGTGPDGEPLVKLIDLGIARTLGGGGGGYLTQAGTFLGKVRYAPPEQFGEAGASAIDARGDIYAFGVVFYELLTGRYPIRGLDPSSLMAGHLFWPPLDFAESDPAGRIPEALRALALQALAKKPEERFATAQELARALAAFRTPADLDGLDLPALLRSPDLGISGISQLREVPPGSTQDRLDLQFGLRTTPSPSRVAAQRSGHEIESGSDQRVSAMSEPRRITERYRLEKRVSSKDSGSIFRAVDTLSGETVAVKLINTGDSEEHREPFEARLAALRNVHHPALPRILDFGFTTAGSAFLVTEYVSGDDLGDLVDAPPARVLSFLLQLVDGLEALAARGLAVRNLSTENLRIATGPDGEQVKILGLGGAAFQGEDAEDGGASGPRADLRAFAHLAVRALALPVQAPGEEAIALPLEVAGALTEPERLRELLDAALHGDPGQRFPDWMEVRRALRTALFGETGRRPAAPSVPSAPSARAQTIPAPQAPASSGGSAGGTAQIPRMAAWEEVRLGQGAPPVPWEGDATMAVEKLGPAAPRSAPPAVPDLTTRVFRPEELAPPPPAVPAGETVRLEVPGRARADAGRQGTVRIPLKDLVEEAPAAEPLRFPRPATPATPVPPPLPPPVPTATPAAVPAPAPRAAAPRRPMNKELRLALLIGVPLTLLLAAGVALVAWMSRRSAQPEPAPQVQVAQPKQAPKPQAPSPAPKPVHAQILLAEESLNSSELAAAKTALDSILPEDIALFTAEEQDRYQRARDALTPLQSQQWAGSLTRGLSTGDLRLLRTVAASPPDAATLTPEQKKNLARAKKILDLDSRLSKAQRAKNHPETVRQAGLLLAELPRNTRAAQARDQAADALLAEADARTAQAQFDASLAALEQLRAVWSDHPGVAERLERIRTERRADDQMEDALAAAARAENSERPLDGLQALDRMRPNERYAERFQQARERLQSQLARLDQNPPQISMTGPSELSYKEEETVTIPLRISDDQGVKSTEAWVRPEGGRFTKVFVRHLGGSDYALEIGPDLHQRKSIDFYLTATDQSGHEGALGTVQRPQRIKRKGWLSKVLGGKEGG